MSSPLDEIIKKIQELPIKEALAVLVANGVYDFSKEGYSNIKEIIRKKYDEKKYAFVPNKKEANRLLAFENAPDFKKILSLVPNYRYIDLIRTGMLMNYYHFNNSLENRTRVQEIKLQIMHRPNGKRLLKLADLPTTPFFEIIIEHLNDLQKDGYSIESLEDTLEEIIEEWEDTTRLVKNNDKIEDIIKFCRSQVDRKNSLFILLGMRSASKIVMDVVHNYELSTYLLKNGYKIQETTTTIGNQPRTEVLFYKSIV